MPKVFISSTSKDLKHYRQAAIDACIQLGLEAVAMEDFPAEDISPLQGSLKKLDECDGYVLIVAHRYGHIPAGKTSSITELEFDEAGRIGLERLCFIVDENHPWPVTEIEIDKIKELRTFKDKISGSLIRKDFTTVDDFASKLDTSLKEWMRKKHISIPPPVPKSITSNVPPLTQAVIGREEEIAELKRRLGIGAESIHRQDAVCGWPGVGKTTLIKALAYDDEIKGAFPDGILWAVVGEDPVPIRELSNWAAILGGAIFSNDPEKVKQRVQTLLENKRCLLIVDDIWNLKDILPYLVGGKDCRTIFTTRFPDIASHIRGDFYRLGLLSAAASYQLLRYVAPRFVDQFPAESQTLIDDIERLPLAIHVAGRMLELEMQIGSASAQGLFKDVEKWLLSAPAPIDRAAETGDIPQVEVLLERSSRRLSPDGLCAFARLGSVAPKPATFDHGLMAMIWRRDDPLPLIRELIGRGLLEVIPEMGRFQMHALLVIHARHVLDAHAECQ